MDTVRIVTLIFTIVGAALGGSWLVALWRYRSHKPLRWQYWTLVSMATTGFLLAIVSGVMLSLGR